MPRKYERIRDKEIAKGTPAKRAKAKAARIYNAQRSPGQKPVTRKHASGKKMTPAAAKRRTAKRGTRRRT